MENNIYIFIDAANLWEVQKAKGKFLDFEKLVKYLKKEFQVAKLEIFYYTAYPEEGTRDYSIKPKHDFFVYLEKGLGFKVKKKKLKRINTTTDQGTITREKGNMDVEITIDAMFYIDKYHSAALFSGDSDFLALVSYLKKEGKDVYIFSSKNNVSEELRTGGSRYFDILKINDDIWGNGIKHRSRKKWFNGQKWLVN